MALAIDNGAQRDRGRAAAQPSQLDRGGRTLPAAPDHRGVDVPGDPDVARPAAGSAATRIVSARSGSDHPPSMPLAASIGAVRRPLPGDGCPPGLRQRETARDRLRQSEDDHATAKLVQPFQARCVDAVGRAGEKNRLVALVSHQDELAVGYTVLARPAVLMRPHARVAAAVVQ